MTQKLPYGCSTAKILRSQVVNGFVLTDTLYAPHLKLPRHSHERACFSFVLKGGFTEEYRNTTRACLPASIIYLPPGEVHSDNFHSDGARCLHIELASEVVSRLREHSMVVEDSRILNGKILTHLIVKLCKELIEPDSVSSLALEALALELIVESSREARKTSSVKSQCQVGRARDFIHEHFSEHVTLSHIAESIGAHPVYLAREFHKHYRCSVGEYIRRLRIEFACRRILDSDDSLASIALSTGFFDQSHFSRTFKLLTGMSPAKYRNSFRRG
jgi:AraC family transcriptional regulator